MSYHSHGLKNRDISALSQAAEEFHQHDKSYKRASFVSFLIYLLTIVLVVFALRNFIIEPIRVDGDSMYPTLYSNERILVEKVSHWFHAPKRGEIIICYYPGYTVSCVKRVIGLPGETIRIQNNIIYINDAPLDESSYWSGYMYSDLPETVIPDDHVFVMGDNRNNSLDSRNLMYVGPIPYHKIAGHVVCVFWPISNLRGVEAVTY